MKKNNFVIFQIYFNKSEQMVETFPLVSLLSNYAKHDVMGGPYEN